MRSTVLETDRQVGDSLAGRYYHFSLNEGVCLEILPCEKRWFLGGSQNKAIRWWRMYRDQTLSLGC